MIIGVPRERKEGECRVALTPDGAAVLHSRGHRVLIEHNAGKLSGFSDREYQDSGAEIIGTLEEVWGQAELLVKVKEPAPEELSLFRRGLAVFSFLHPAVAPEMMKAMLQSEVTGIDYDLVMLDDQRLPILEPMSVIAGKLSIQCGAYALQSTNGGRGVLLGGAVGVRPARVVVIGAGAAGSSAAQVAIGMGADVVVMDINSDKLQPFSKGALRAITVQSSPVSLEREIRAADLVIGAVLIPGALAPKLLSRKMLGGMKAGSVIVDICIDQGGMAESSRPTTISQPTYVDSGVVHYCVPNMPALVPRTSTIALTNATLRWIVALSEKGILAGVSSLPPLRRSVVSYKGRLTNRAIGDALSLPVVDFATIA
ncbi:MAG: alanine dehydrogenase [Bdellovibrionota bacterium]